MKTLYWHDYETWGATPSVDRPSQFAGVRTDEDLNIIGEPLVVYCQPPQDIWPNPEACLVTGITPQKAASEGVPEREFIRRIHQEFMQAKTCVVGYNSLRFDDEVTRYTLYRNFYDPYEREWRNGNSRWDIIDMLRLTFAVRPEGIEWPVVDGKPSFKLELLTQANGISHMSAHDAYSDVEATIEMAKIIKTRKPELYDYVYSNRSKQAVNALIDIQARKPLLHISSRFSSERGCSALIVPLAIHPVNKNAVITYDLSVDPAELATLSAEEIANRVFVAQEDLPEGQERIPLKLVHLNKCPILATPKLVSKEMEARFGLDKNQCEIHWQKIRSMDISAKLQAVFQLNVFEEKKDPEQKLYDGFIGNSDKALMQNVRNLKPENIQGNRFVFEDTRLANILPKYLARNFYSYLTEVEQQEWDETVAHSLYYGGENKLSWQEITDKIGALKQEKAGDSQAIAILNACSDYVAYRYENSIVGHIGK
ncbi:exodeoxyribonuclease I [Teredinibacter sp. KSP-S5-2]|uniref:exodeoxyribonuclease I n=1 Tax=Teredinibacter sp. KSP-S5-2 TaxID=3034506 RepID=UPI0039779030